MMNYFTLMSYVLTWAPKGATQESDKAWAHVLGEAIDGVSPIHSQILSTLTLLSNCLLSGQSLPPYLPLPRPYETMRHLLRQQRPPEQRGLRDQPSTQSLSASFPPLGTSPSYGTLRPDRHKLAAERTTTSGGPEQQLEPVPEAWNLLDARNMEQQGYTEFAVLQVCSTLIIGELRGLIKTVADLVGTVDFSFRVEPYGNQSDTSLESVRRMGTWATRAAENGGGGGSIGTKGKGKND